MLFFAVFSIIFVQECNTIQLISGTLIIWTISTVFLTTNKFGGWLYTLINLQTFLKICYIDIRLTFLGQIVIGLQNVRVASSNPVPSLSTKFELLSLSLASILKISTFGTFAKNIFLPLFRICPRINVQDCSK